MKKFVTLSPELKTFEDRVIKKLPRNWGRIKGGKKRVSQMENIERMTELRKKLKVKSKVFEELIKNDVDLKCVLATCLLTDGSLTVKGNHYGITYSTKDETSRNLVTKIILSLSEVTPSISQDKKEVYTIRISDKKLDKNLMKLSPSYKKSSSKHQTKEEYLKEPQPTIKFLRKCDGCISVSRRGFFELSFTCYHSQLSLEWLNLFHLYGTKGKLGKRKDSWSGIGGIRMFDLESSKNFWKLGGFIPGVKITRKSKRFYGLEKNKLLEYVVKGGLEGRGLGG